MSMLSAQCDELRATAESVGLAMPQAATLMMEAADTIDQLAAENAKLRGQYEAVIDDYRSEVAKLRELCRYLRPFAESCGAEHPLMRELGVEVSE